MSMTRLMTFDVGVDDDASVAAMTKIKYIIVMMMVTATMFDILTNIIILLICVVDDAV